MNTTKSKSRKPAQKQQIVQEPILSFSFSVKLLSKKLDVEMSGSISKTHWRTEYLKTADEAAWAHVRHMLLLPGRWDCRVNGDKRIIQVTKTADGHLIRLDHKVA